MGGMIAKGTSLEEIRRQMGVFAEGYVTLDFALDRARENNLDLPLMQLIRKVIDHPENANHFLSDFIDMQS
jgi:glycerol-3-phosphate dehydrogenase